MIKIAYPADIPKLECCTLWSFLNNMTIISFSLCLSYLAYIDTLLKVEGFNCFQISASVYIPFFK